MVVGTYTVSPERVYVNCRLIDPASSMVASVGSVEMYKTAEITRLLRTNNFPPSLERIPVRHLGYGRMPPLHYYPYFMPPSWAPDPSMGYDAEEESAPVPVLPKSGLSAPKGGESGTLSVPGGAPSASGALHPNS